MEQQNITLALPKELLRRVKHIAIDQGTSVSGLLARMLEELVQREDGYREARERQLAMLDKGFDLGTEGKVAWQREDLHERR